MVGWVVLPARKIEPPAIRADRRQVHPPVYVTIRQRWVNQSAIRSFGKAAFSCADRTTHPT